MNKMPLSVIIITKNEQDNIEDCLESVKWAEEIIIVDSGSTDQTEAICRKFTDNFYVKDWPGFGIQKQRSLELASREWVLSIDADERVTPELKSEIIDKITQNSNIGGYLIPRLSNYLGKDIYHAGWFPDYTLRLVKRKEAYFTRDVVHEKMIVKRKVEKLSNHFVHFPFKNIEHHFQKMNDYSTLSANKMYKEGRKISWILIVLKTLLAFIRSYILKLGALDGWPGFTVSVSTSLSVYMKYVKLKELSLFKEKSNNNF